MQVIFENKDEESISRRTDSIGIIICTEELANV